MDGNRVVAAKFQTVGCGATIACGSILTELIAGRTVAECGELTANSLIEAAGWRSRRQAPQPGARHHGSARRLEMR